VKVVGERRAIDSLPWSRPVKDFFQKEDRATPGLAKRNAIL
jgi:hypothetical protein